MIIKTTKVKDMTFFKRKNGTYQSKVTINGERKTFYGKSKNEIRLKYQEYLKDIEIHGGNVGLFYYDVTLNDFIEYWLETYKLRTIEPSSYDKLERIYIYQIKDTIGSMKLDEVTTKDIQDLINTYASPKDDTVRPMAKSSLKKIKQLLDQCYKVAVKEKRVKSNPCESVYIPRDMFIDVETKSQFSLTDAQMSDLKKIALSQAPYGGGYKYRDGLVIMIMLNTGLRAGEMLALEWSDVDLDNKTISVNKIVQYKIIDRTDSERKRVDRIKKGSKTKAGCRVLPINDSTVHYFKEIMKNNQLHGIESKYVCSTRTGKRQTHRNLFRSLTTICKHSEIIPQETSLHTLRHTFGSKLIRSGVEVSTVSKLMGHSRISVTYDKYVHVIQEEAAKAMNLIEIA